MYSAKVILDSINKAGNRLTTMEVCFPRCVLSEFNTHRQFSRNSASSRAIPIEKQIKKIVDSPYIPIFTKNQKGMQGKVLKQHSPEYIEAKEVWLKARDLAVEAAENLLKVGIHKQNTNRLLEPFMWHTVIVTATEWSNFFALRCDPAAQPEIQEVANLMKHAYNQSFPTEVVAGGWHLPYIQEDEHDYGIETKQKLSIARCARVSYLTHDGKRDIDADAMLYDRLLDAGHMSPFEHVASPAYRAEEDYAPSNFKGWTQYRKLIQGECR